VLKMRNQKKPTGNDVAPASYAITAQPSYHRDVKISDIIALQEAVDARKPSNFSLTPVSDAGW
jgi:hypothetical protein